MIDIDAIREELGELTGVVELCDYVESLQWLVKFKNVEIDNQRATSERRLQLMARNWRERNAALADVEELRLECERLRELKNDYVAGLKDALDERDEWKMLAARLDLALGEHAHPFDYDHCGAHFAYLQTKDRYDQSK